MLADILFFTAAFGSLCWISILILPWRPWSTREHLEAVTGAATDLSDVTVLIPARDEAEAIETTMKGLNAQGKNLSIILVDDQSSDGTAIIARKTTEQNLQIISGSELPQGWAGKLWALEQGRKHVRTKTILLLDADIELSPGMLSALIQKMKSENLDFVSIMAKLQMEIFYEKLLIPSFVYFFKLLYPFSLGNSRKHKLGVAAGGCILLKTDVLEKIGGFGALRGALIDDCTLAQTVKSKGFHTWIGLSHSVKSHRGYKDLAGLWNMVARSAFTQLKYSTLLLVACTFIMLSMFWMPLLGLTLSPSRPLKLFCALGWISMVLSYLPILVYYRRSPFFTFLMPFIGSLYLLMTWTSAIRYFFGRRSEWKGRIYGTEAA
ncbi:MAG: glycosyl transferase family 2 [Bacteriovoracaceae bacterium]|nr:glycosyl transferase family 2 [Bacteriovoracaceae bacterium]